MLTTTENWFDLTLMETGVGHLGDTSTHGSSGMEEEGMGVEAGMGVDLLLAHILTHTLHALTRYTHLT